MRTCLRHMRPSRAAALCCHRSARALLPWHMGTWGRNIHAPAPHHPPLTHLGCLQEDVVALVAHQHHHAHARQAAGLEGKARPHGSVSNPACLSMPEHGNHSPFALLSRRPSGAGHTAALPGHRSSPSPPSLPVCSLLHPSHSLSPTPTTRSLEVVGVCDEHDGGHVVRKHLQPVLALGLPQKQHGHRLAVGGEGMAAAQGTGSVRWAGLSCYALRDGDASLL